MKRRQVNRILKERAKRRKTILGQIVVILILLNLALCSVIIYVKRNKRYEVGYEEKSNIDYKVYLKDNPYYKEEYLEENNEYLEKLIDYVNANFEYGIKIDKKEVEYKYSYKIDAEVVVRKKGNTNPIYKFTDNIKKEIESKATSEEELKIKEELKIDYNNYNDLIKGFVSTYSLDDIESNLVVRMYIDVVGSCEEFKEDSKNEAILELNIPLTTKTVDIDIMDNLVNTTDRVMICKKDYKNTNIFMVSFIISIILIGIIIIRLIKYIIVTRNPLDVYKKKLAEILDNYGSYIEESDSKIDIEKYEVWKIKEFNDMLEISDRINQPIIMMQNKEKTNADFIILTMDNKLYLYSFTFEDGENNED